MVRSVVDARSVPVGPTVPSIDGLLTFELYVIGGAVYGVAFAILELAALDAAGSVRGDGFDPQFPGDNAPTPDDNVVRGE